MPRSQDARLQILRKWQRFLYKIRTLMMVMDRIEADSAMMEEEFPGFSRVPPALSSAATTTTKFPVATNNCRHPSVKKYGGS